MHWPQKHRTCLFLGSLKKKVKLIEKSWTNEVFHVSMTEKIQELDIKDDIICVLYVHRHFYCFRLVI